MGQLDGKTAIITGGAGGIGLASARLFLDEGANVMLVGRTLSKLAAAKDTLGGADTIAVCAADVSDEVETEAFCKATVEAFGGIDILFGNAGTEGSVKPFLNFSVEEFDTVMNINIRGSWLSMKHAAPHMIARGGGSIILTGSVVSSVGVPGISPYCASKHAIAGLARTISQELAESKIRVNAIAPSPVDNDMMKSIETQAAPDAPDAARQNFLANIPMGRYATNDEVAKLALFLAGDHSEFLTGAVLPIDGGFTAR